MKTLELEKNVAKLRMYDKFVNFIAPFVEQRETSDYWYDVAVDSAQEILEQFSDIDWIKLEKSLDTQSIEFKQKLAYCLDNENNIHQFKILIYLLNSDDDELLETCFDSLRSFINVETTKQLLNDNSIIEKIKNIISNSGKPTQLVLKDLLNKINTFTGGKSILFDETTSK